MAISHRTQGQTIPLDYMQSPTYSHRSQESAANFIQSPLQSSAVVQNFPNYTQSPTLCQQSQGAVLDLSQSTHRRRTFNLQAHHGYANPQDMTHPIQSPTHRRSSVYMNPLTQGQSVYDLSPVRVQSPSRVSSCTLSDQTGLWASNSRSTYPTAMGKNTSAMSDCETDYGEETFE